MNPKIIEIGEELLAVTGLPDGAKIRYWEYGIIADNKTIVLPIAPATDDDRGFEWEWEILGRLNELTDELKNSEEIFPFRIQSADPNPLILKKQ